MILYNGVVWTVDEKNPAAEAVAIKGNKILYVGKNEDALRYRAPQTRTIDLKGSFVVPGFNDNHVHFASAAQFLEFNIMRVSTQEEFVARVKEVVSRLPKGEWILGGYWGAYDQWAASSAGSQQREQFTPDMSLVKELTKDHALFIRKFDDTEFAVNEAGLKAAVTLNSQTPDVELLKDRQGNFNGHLRGKGVLPIFNRVIPPTFSRERRIQQTKNALAEIRKFGVTNISDMSDDLQLDSARTLATCNSTDVFRITIRAAVRQRTVFGMQRLV